MSLGTRWSLVAALTFLLHAGPADALFRAYLASDGSDSNPCTLPQPCRLLPAALAAVDDGGEIWMLDSANYNTAGVVIGKSVTLLAVPGAVGSVLTLDYESAITVSAPGLKVSLRNLVIRSLAGNPGWQGVEVLAASRVTIENCLIASVPYNGVRVAGGTVAIVDSMIRDSGGYGVIVFENSAADISRSQVLRNEAGGLYAYAFAAGQVRMTVSDSVVSGVNSGSDSGIIAKSENVGGEVRVYLTRSTISRSMWGLRNDVSAGTAVIGIANSAVANNAYGWFITGAGASIKTAGNNYITEGGFSGTPLTLVPLQ